MSRVQLVASLALWMSRHTYRAGRLRAAKKAKNAARIRKWTRLDKIAVDRIALRKKQLKTAARKVWMPGVRILRRADAGTFITGKPKGVLHTTQGDGDATSTLDKNGDHPHFQVERNGRITQYIAINRAAKALKHTGSPETNRAHAIQIEVVGFAEHPHWPAAQVKAVRRVMRFIEANGGVKRSCTVKFVAGTTNHMSASHWLEYNGWCGHQHVPENDHEDPGAIDIHELLG